MRIIEISGRDLDFIAHVFRTAHEQGQSVKIAEDGGVKVKRGASVWSPPLGYPVDSNGERIG